MGDDARVAQAREFVEQDEHWDDVALGGRTLPGIEVDQLL